MFSLECQWYWFTLNGVAEPTFPRFDPKEVDPPPANLWRRMKLALQVLADPTTRIIPAEHSTITLQSRRVLGAFKARLISLIRAIKRER
jgi:hypothetical protein